jgi:hypothetical protein
MNLQQISSKILSATLAAALCITPELWAQNSQSPSQSPAAQQPETAQQPQPSPGSTAPAGTQTPPANPQPAAPANQGQTQQPPATSGTTVNPSQGPLQPVTTYPDASGAQQTQEPADVNATQTTTTAPEAPKPKQPSQPVGAATAERVPTAGGAAAKPAGAAIAPAKQHQTRSLLIKIGAIAAAGAALGTVYGLSRSSPSKPPGSAGIPPR